jgi:hypothetical protein
MRNSLSGFSAILLLIVMAVVLLLVARAWNSVAPTAVQLSTEQPLDPGSGEDGEAEESNRLPDLQETRKNTDEHKRRLEEARKQIDE